MCIKTYGWYHGFACGLAAAAVACGVTFAAFLKYMAKKQKEEQM